MELEWNISKVQVLSKAGESDVISQVTWELTATEDDKYAKRNGIQQLDTTDLSGFTSFEDVTQEQLATWVQNAMGSEFNKLKLILNQELDNIMTDIHEEDIG